MHRLTSHPSHISLKQFNTFGIEVSCSKLVVIHSVSELIGYLKNQKSEEFYILGGGSNVLFTQNFNGTVLLNRIEGISYKWLNENDAFVTAGSGEVWHQLVTDTLKQNLGGLENLSLIPGTVGAAPMQNIGAYGVELKDIFVELKALNLGTLEEEVFRSSDCAFGYRESVFKHALKNKYFITSVTLRLSRKAHLNTSYGAIESELNAMGIKHPDFKDVSRAVINIRQSKLPDPAVIGNAGSFFKNPVVSSEHYAKLLAQFPEMPSYPAGEHQLKIPAGWLIEQCGWKGKQIGNTGSHAKQALVLVNYGNATGREIFKLANAIQQSVKDKFEIKLEMEVNII